MHDLIRKAGNISVHVIAGDDMAESMTRPATVVAAAPPVTDSVPYIVALAAVAVALAICLLFRPLFGIENVDLVFVTAIVGIAVRYGLWPSVAACIAASLCYNFFFLPPVHTFTITEPTNIAAFVMFTLVSVIVSNLAARGRADTVAAEERVRSLESLYGFSRKLAGAGTLDDVLWATAFQIASMLKVRAVVLLPKAERDRGQGRLPARGSSG